MCIKCDIWLTNIILCVTWYVSGTYTNMNDVPAMRLYKNLTSNYVKQVPVLNYNDTVQVTTAMRLYQLLDLDSSSETMAVTGELILTWKDAFLRWSLEEYPDVIALSIPANQVCIFILLLLSNKALYWFTAIGSKTVFYSKTCYKLPDWLLRGSSEFKPDSLYHI